MQRARPVLSWCLLMDANLLKLLADLAGAFVRVLLNRSATVRKTKKQKARK